MLFVLAAAFCAVGARAQDQAPAAGSDQSQAAPQTKEQKKAAWQAGVKTDCAAEIADGGVCAGKDFGTGLEKCLHENRAKLSNGCRATVHPHKKGAKKSADAQPAAAPAAAPQTPAATPQ